MEIITRSDRSTAIRRERVTRIVDRSRTAQHRFRSIDTAVQQPFAKSPPRR
jgi:hypothetical protein